MPWFETGTNKNLVFYDFYIIEDLFHYVTYFPGLYLFARSITIIIASNVRISIDNTTAVKYNTIKELR
jgi:hypothetical protein